MIKLLLYYNFVLISIMVVAGFLNASSMPELISAIMFFPLLIYFTTKILPKNNRAIYLPEIINQGRVVQSPKVSLEDRDSEPVNPIRLKQTFDKDRRMFIKLIGSAGLTVFFFSIFSKKAHGAFFGSVPGPGTVALKDTTGAQVDPAIKHPTDGYRIAQLDDSSPAYYGYIDKNGLWFILKEDSSAGTYRYAKGSSGFSTNWTNRTSLTYDYYDAVF